MELKEVIPMFFSISSKNIGIKIAWKNTPNKAERNWNIKVEFKI
jgi:hypothetical protein